MEQITQGGGKQDEDFSPILERSGEGEPGLGFGTDYQV